MAVDRSDWYYCVVEKHMSHSELPSSHDAALVDDLEDMRDLQELMQKYSDSPDVYDVCPRALWLWDPVLGAYWCASDDRSARLS